MENQNNQAPIQEQQVPPVQSQPQEVPQPATKAKFQEKIKLQVEKLKTKINSLPKGQRLMVTIAIILFVIMFVLVILAALFGKKQGQQVFATPSPSPISVTPAPNVVLNASRYATDSGVLKIESDLNGFQQQLQSSDVKQSDLSIPNLDFNINFNQ